MLTGLDREKSGFNISIATGLAIESLFKPIEDVYDDPKRKVTQIDHTIYKSHYFNAYTLIRNIVAAVPTIQKTLLIRNFNRSSIVKDALIEELYVLKLLYEQNTKITPILFIPDYTKLIKNITPKEMKTPPTIGNEMDLIYKEVLLLVKKDEIPINILSGTHLLTSSQYPTLITTHVMFDLLNVNKIPKLELLESTTGAIKKKMEFNTKYAKAGTLDLTVLPFTEQLAYAYGDESLCKSIKYSIKKEVYDMIIKNKWTQYTSQNLVNSEVKTILNKNNIKTVPIY